MPTRSIGAPRRPRRRAAFDTISGGMKIKRAEKYGFCAGVRIADRKVKKFAQLGERDGHLLGQVVHNERVVEEMAQLGVDTVHGMDEVPGGTIIFSAHGVPPSFHD